MTSSHLKRISENIIYLPANHETDRPVLAAISGEHTTLLMDAGNSPAHAAHFRQQLQGFPLPPIQWLVLTHWHWDHVFGTKAMNLPTIAHTATKRQLEAMLGWEWTDEALDRRVAEGLEIPFCADMIKKEFGEDRSGIQIVLPALCFEQKLEVDLGNVTCVLEHIGGDHAEDSCLLYVKEDKVLFLGDCMGPAIYCPERYFTAERLLPLLDRIESFDAEVYVPSHSEPMTKEQMRTELYEYRTLMQLTHEHQGNRKRIAEGVQALWGRALNDGDESFIDWFIAGYRLSTP